MPEDQRRKRIHKGMFLTQDCVHAEIDPRTRERALRRQFPDFEEMLDHVGPPPSAARLEQLAEERRQLAARMDDIKRRIAALTGKAP